MRILSNRVRRFVGFVLMIVVLLGLLLGFFVHRIGRRQQFLVQLEERGAGISGNQIGDPNKSPAGSKPGWLVRSAAAVHAKTGLGQPQRFVRMIRAEGSSFGDEQLRFLSEAKELRHLYVKASEITDESVAGMAALHELRTVDLSCTRVTDRSLEYLRQCESLRTLMVNETKISRTAIEAFRDRRPDVHVQWSEATSEERRRTVGQLLAHGGQLLFGGTSSFASRRRPDTIVIRGRWRRDVDHEEQAECLALAAKLTNCSSLQIHGLSLADPEFEILKQFDHIRFLQLDRMRTQDYRWITSFAALESIDCGDRVPTDRVLEHACRLPQLRSVIAEDATDRTAAHIAQAENLETIWLRASNVSDRAIEQWSHLDKLQRLILDAPNITNRSLETIGTFPQLSRLELNNSQIDDEGLVHLQQLTRLRYLSLNETNVTPAGFIHLIPLVQLDQLRWLARGSNELEHIDLLDEVMNLFWTELSFASDDELHRLLLDFIANAHETETFLLQGQQIDVANPNDWLDTLLELLTPVREFRARSLTVSCDEKSALAWQKKCHFRGELKNAPLSHVGRCQIR